MAIVERERVKTILAITSYDYDDRIDVFIPQVEADYLSIRGKDFDVDSNDEIVYPNNAEVTASLMIGYLLSTTQFGGSGISDKQSESIGSYSYTRAASSDLYNGYPRSIVSRIERWASPK